MLIKKLRMENFRQFKGTTNVEFSTNPAKNVTVILGDNTFGKTTLLQAFNWCFYGTVVFPHNPDFLLNLEKANDMINGDTRDVEVEITVIHPERHPLPSGRLFPLHNCWGIPIAPTAGAPSVPLYS